MTAMLGTFAHLGFEIVSPRWKLVTQVPKGSVLPKGRQALSRDVILAARRFAERFGVYSWGTEAQALYCGSFSRDYNSSQFESNFEGRIHQYFCNHKRHDGGVAKNTNALVFDRINDAWRSDCIVLRLFDFDELRSLGALFGPSQYASDSGLVRAVERVVIWAHKQKGECAWNDRVEEDA
jgi:hypothetical protein